MSLPKSIPSSSSVDMAPLAGHPLLSQSRRPIPSGADGYPLPATSFTSFVGGGDGGGHHTYTYNRKREVSRSEHQGREPAREGAHPYAQTQAQTQTRTRTQAHAHAHAHEHNRNTGAAPGPFKAGVPAGIGNTNINHNNFHYNQKTRRHDLEEFGGNSYYYIGDDNSDFDDDIDRDDFDDEARQSDRGGGVGVGAGIGGDYRLQRDDDDSPFKQDANENGNQKQSDLDQLHDQSRLGNSFFALTDGGLDNDTLSTTKPNQFTEPTSAVTDPHHRDQIEFNTRNSHLHQHKPQPNRYDYLMLYYGSVEGDTANYSRTTHQHPRAASSSAFYSTGRTQTHSKSISTSRSPVSPPWTRTRASPPTAPPRVSSLLPPPRNNNTNAAISTITGPGTTNNPRLPLSSSNRPITPIIPEQSVSPPATTNPNPNSNPNFNPTSEPTPNSTSNTTTTTTTSSPRFKLNSNSASPSDAIIREAPTHAQFAISFLDPLNNLQQKPVVPHLPSTSAPDFGSGKSTGSGSGSGTGTGTGAGPSFAHKRIHSRSSSIGAVGDSLRNLNRWSSSTTSSRLSAWDYHHYQQQQAQQEKLSRFSRRMSVDSIGLLSQPSDTVQESLPPTFASPRKLNKRRPSQGNNSASPKTRTRSRADSASRSVVGFGAAVGPGAFSGPPLPPPSGPPPNLPPIVSLPPLDTDQSNFRLGSPTPRAMSRASPALNTPNSLFASQNANGEPRDYFWSDLSNPERTASPATRVNTALLPPAPVTRDREREATPESRGHSRSRSTTKGSGDSTKNRERSTKPSQKAMLSKALNKANTAVKLDNAQNYVAARDAYIEACELLQQVLSRTNGDEDRKKLDAIRRTYTSRIEELDVLVPTNPQEDKALPARPDSLAYHGVQIALAGADSQSDAATVTRSNRDESPNPQVSSNVITPTPSDPATTYSDFARAAEANSFLPSFSVGPPLRRNFEGSSLAIPRADNSFLPAPLSPFRPTSPAVKPPSPEPVVRQDFSLAAERERLAAAVEYRSHRRNLSHESASWLDPIDESGGSAGSSVHSRSSSRIIRKHIRQPSGNTEAEFDAALDAAVEAAYDDGYEPAEPSATAYDVAEVDNMSFSMRKVALARERVRETEREAAIEAANNHERQRQMSVSQESQTYGGGFFDANDSDEEEERMLEEMTRSFAMEDFTLSQNARSQSSVPRESDSSGLTSRTWHSSMQSNPPTGTTTLSTVSEMALAGGINASSPPSMPPPTQSLPQPPVNRLSSAAGGMRNRRVSSQKQLRIETSKLGPPPTMPLPSKSAGGYIAQQRQALSATSTRGPFSSLAPSSPVRGVSPADAAVPMSPLSDHDEEFETGSPTFAPPSMHKNFSSSSLRSLKLRQLSSSHIEEHDPSPMTPLSRQVSNTSVSRQPMMPALPTPIVAAFAEKMGGGFGGLSLFDTDFHPVDSPSSSHHHYHHHQQQNPDIPLPLEPCPSDAMLRPFWLMRALYQTLAHPRGGYLSNRLFVPRDAWKVKGVKLRNVDDKVSQCDLLTAALLKLARVDSTDADALLHEMESLEVILETVQATLTRRLGAEVGSQGMVGFKDDSVNEPPPIPRNNSVSVKSGAFSWRRLRSKGSAVNLASTYGVKAGGNGSSTAVSGIAEKDVVSPGGSMPSLPMVAQPSSRPAKRDVTSVKFDGPNANYMASLARLFDAAQTVDQIARQVDDPGLRHADKTQVGLELCTRHAAEFFGFYICRFVLADLAVLLDKFVKRGSEWVLS